MNWKQLTFWTIVWVASVAFVPAFGPAQESDIFATIWNMPESHVGVTRIGEDGKPIDPSAKVAVHEQGRAGSCLDQDNAPAPLLSHVDESLFEEASFKTFIALLDNYTAVEGRPEVTFEQSDHENWREVEAYLDAMFASKPVQTAVQHIQTELDKDATVKQIRAAARKMWFEPYTNRYSNSMPFCTGFEHVFVGEDESNAKGAPRCSDKVAGYHSWIKFYLEQKQNKTNYLGYDYPEGNVEDALADPNVATMVMRWSPTKEEDGSHGHDLMKKPGGFFVGTRPELEFSFGLLAMYSIHAEKYNNVPGRENHHRVKLGDNFVDLVMHPQSLSPPSRGAKSKRGWHIRTLYPKFRGRQIPTASSRGSAAPVVQADLPTQPHNNAPIMIKRALANTDQENDEGEWVELQNRTDATTFDLSNWKLSDQNARREKLTGTLAPGETLRVYLSRTNDKSMMLKNGPGWILLYQGDVRRAAVQYAKPQEEVIIDFRK